MSRSLLFVWLLLLAAGVVLADDAAEAERDASTAKAEKETDASEVDRDATEAKGSTEKGPKLISGMSILGNQEAPKSLVIVPWKSSELGDNISLSDTLDDRARPVDKEVFLRELHFYEIRAGKAQAAEKSSAVLRCVMSI